MAIQSLAKSGFTLERTSERLPRLRIVAPSRFLKDAFVMAWPRTLAFLPDAAVVGCKVRARGGCESAAREGALSWSPRIGMIGRRYFGLQRRGMEAVVK